LVSTTGDADLYIYDPLLPGDAALVDSSELRNTDDSVTLSVTGQDGYFDIDVVAHLDSNYELSVTEIFLISDPAIPSEEELAAYNYTLNGATLLLAKDSNCLACHSTETNIVGPSFKAISLRFKDIPDAETRLIEIVKNGGKGIWGIIPMPPSSPEVSDQNIGLLVHSILFGD
jgi:cytochrome c